MSGALTLAIALFAIVLNGDPCWATMETVSAPWPVDDCERVEGFLSQPRKQKDTTAAMVNMDILFRLNIIAISFQKENKDQKINAVDKIDKC